MKVLRFIENPEPVQTIEDVFSIYKEREIYEERKYFLTEFVERELSRLKTYKTRDKSVVLHEHTGKIFSEDEIAGLKDLLNFEVSIPIMYGGYMRIIEDE